MLTVLAKFDLPYEVKAHICYWFWIDLYNKLEFDLVQSLFDLDVDCYYLLQEEDSEDGWSGTDSEIHEFERVWDNYERNYQKYKTQAADTFLFQGVQGPSRLPLEKEFWTCYKEEYAKQTAKLRMVKYNQKVCLMNFFYLYMPYRSTWTLENYEKCYKLNYIYYAFR